jgi:hypothetical protein
MTAAAPRRRAGWPTRLVFVGLVAATGCLPASNVYDPNAPIDAQARAAVTGRVVQALVGVADRPTIGGASVVVRLSDGTFVDATFDGETFSARDLLPGAVTVEASATGYNLQTLALTLGPGETRDLEIALVPSTDVPGSGRLTGIATREARLDHAGIEVRATELLDDSDPRTPRVVVGLTNDSGGFDLTAPRGRYAVSYSATNYQVTSGGEHDVVEDAVLDLGATQLPFIPGIAQGTVLVEEDGALLEPVLVGLIGGLVGIAEVEPDGEGQFTINPAPPGEFFVRAHAGARYVPATSTELLTVVPGDVPSVLEETLVLRRARGSVTGYVLLSAPPDGSHAGTLVQVAGTSYSGSTDDSGRFTIVDVPTGTYALHASKEGYLSDDILGVVIQHNGTAVASTEAEPLRLSRQVGDFTIGDGYTNTLEVTLDVVAPESAARIRSANAPFADDTTGFEDFDANAPVTHLLEGNDGLKTVYVQFELGDGTLGTVLEGTVRLDRIPPTIGALTLGDGSGFSTHPTGTVLVAVSASDGPTGTGITTLQYREADDSFPDPATDANTRTYGEPFELTFADGATDGARSLFVRVFDAAGNESTVSSASVTLDRTAPVVMGLQLLCDALVGATLCDQTTIGL